MVSTGFFLEKKYTGRTVDITAVTTAMPNIISTESIPKANGEKVMPIDADMFEFTAAQVIAVAKVDTRAHISTIIMDSDKKIFNTSLLFAPTARSMPISRFLSAMDTLMKLNSRRA